MFWEYDVMLSMRPLMVTFGAAGWANAIGAARATRAKAIIRTARVVLFIEALLNQVDDVQCCNVCASRLPAVRATTVRLEKPVSGDVTPLMERNRKTLDILTANRLHGSTKKPHGIAPPWRQ